MKRLAAITILCLPFLCFAKPVTFEWSDNSDNETGFELWEVSSEGEPLELITKTEVDINKVAVEGTLIAGKSVAVRAYNDFGESGFSNIVLVPNVPEIPSGFKIVITITLENS